VSDSTLTFVRLGRDVLRYRGVWSQFECLAAVHRANNGTTSGSEEVVRSQKDEAEMEEDQIDVG